MSTQMMIPSKIIIHGHWIYDHDTGWKLAVYPIATINSRALGNHPVILTSESNLTQPNPQCDLIDRLFSFPTDSRRTMTMYNLGSFKVDAELDQLDMYLICPVANIKDGLTHSTIIKEGYLLIEDYEPIPEEAEPLDEAIFDALSRLEAPHQFTCE